MKRYGSKIKWNFMNIQKCPDLSLQRSLTDQSYLVRSQQSSLQQHKKISINNNDDSNGFQMITIKTSRSRVTFLCWHLVQLPLTTPPLLVSLRAASLSWMVMVLSNCLLSPILSWATTSSRNSPSSVLSLTLLIRSSSQSVKRVNGSYQRMMIVMKLEF